jgi:hypothetical protein
MALTKVLTDKQIQVLDQLPSAVPGLKKHQLADGDIPLGSVLNRLDASRQRKTLKFTYLVSQHGGTAASHTIGDENYATQVLPNKAVITGASLEMLTTADDDGIGDDATVAIGYTGVANAFLTATAFTDGKFTAGVITALTGNVPLKLTADKSVIVTMASSALVAGKFNVYIEYYEGD